MPIDAEKLEKLIKSLNYRTAGPTPGFKGWSLDEQAKYFPSIGQATSDTIFIPFGMNPAISQFSLGSHTYLDHVNVMLILQAHLNIANDASPSYRRIHKNRRFQWSEYPALYKYAELVGAAYGIQDASVYISKLSKFKKEKLGWV